MYSTTASSPNWNFSSTLSGSYTASSNSVSSYFTKIHETDLISCTLKDKTEVTLSFKDYSLFIHIHGISPSECESKSEFDEKMGVIVI